MAEYHLAPAAERDLEEIWTYTVRKWDIEQANRYTDIIMETFANLAERSKTAPACDHIRPGYRRQTIERHTVYFRITSYGIAIIRILYDRMDAPRFL